MHDVTPLRPAAELAAMASRPYPNESPAYRAARTALLAEEIELRRHAERVAALRRALPPGAEVPQDYEFIAEDGARVRLSALFGRHDTLVTFFWMFGAKRERPCPMCTAFVGSLEIPARDLGQHLALAIIGGAPIERQAAFKRERGWGNLNVYATTSDAFARDYRGLSPDGEDWGSLNVFTRKDGVIRRFWGDEMDEATADPGQDQRGSPEVAPVWSILDITPTGRPAHWYPKLEY
jgi:predicted dithiol-disulfide oxidoreductase (DUF899 family)